jgi:hypothetical protein
MSHTNNPAPGHTARDGASQAAKPDGVNYPMTHPRMQAAIAPPARRCTVNHHQAFREAIAPAEEFDDDTDLDFIDRPFARRSDREIARLFDILDNLPPAREETEREARHG